MESFINQPEFYPQMEPGETINVGGTYRHRSGIEYQVEKLLLDATGFESSGNLTPSVLYTQLQDGKFSKGTQYVRSVEDFLRNFEYLGT